MHIRIFNINLLIVILYNFLSQQITTRMKAYICTLLLFSLFLQFGTSQYNTNPVRTQAVNTLCVNFPSRDQLVSSSDAAQYEQYKKMMESSFSVKGSDLFNTIFGMFSFGSSGSSGSSSSFMPSLSPSANPADILQKYPNLPTQYGLFIGPFAVCLILIMFTCLCSCCCCCCPGSCPPSKCCRKEMGKSYSKCQLIWPGLILVLALGIILAAGAIGLTKSKDLQKTIQSIGCSLAITFDDILNGNTTKSSSKYFIGLNTLYNKVDLLKGDLADLNSQLGALPAQLNTASVNANTVKTKIGEIPSGAYGGRVSSIFYNTSFNSASPTGNIVSTISDQLGSTNIADSSSAVYLSTSALATMAQQFSDISTAASSLASTITGGTINSILDGLKPVLKDLSDKLLTGNNMYYSIYSQVNPVMPTINTAVTGVYAGFAGISAIALLATLFLLICNIYKCRFLLYFSCLILLFVGIISLFLSIIFSAILPLVYFTCDFTTFTFANSQNFGSTFGKLLPSQIKSMLTVCLPGQSGDILSISVLGNATSSLNQLRTLVDGMNSFDATVINSQVDQIWDPVKNLIGGSASGQLIDFNSPTDYQILEKLSNKNNYLCNIPAFATDSWVPSTQTPNTISCKIAGGALVTNCPAADFQNRVCTGCMDSTALLALYTTNLGTYLGARYNDASCSQFIIELVNTMNHFYVRKGVYTSLLTRVGVTDPTVTTLKGSITTVGTRVNSIKTALSASADMIINPTYGIVSGMNCALFGQDINLIIGTVCTQGFKFIFFLRLAFGMAGFGVLFTIWCASCTGVRHYKQSQALKSKVDQQKDLTNETLQDINPKEINKPTLQQQMGKNPKNFVAPQNITYY